jgi:cob(I)alamin adenosyltransferase
MTDQPFEEPRNITLNRIYTRGGDEGETSLVGGQRVAKDALRIECYGTVDELNAFVGMAQVSCGELPALDELRRILTRVQHELFNLGSILATLPADVHPRQPRITDSEIVRLEEEIDRMNADLPALNSFVLPGGSRINTELHACRTICRRAERAVVALNHAGDADPHAVVYLNRLSDAFFVWSRWANRRLGLPETLWRANEPASGR